MCILQALETMGWRVRYGIFLYTVWICHHDGLNKEANWSIAGQDEVRGKPKQRLLGRRRAKSEVVSFQRKTWDCNKCFPTLPTGLDRIRFSIYTKCCGTQLSKTYQQPHPLRIKVPKFPVCGPYTVSDSSAAMLWTKDIHLGLDQWSSLPDEHQKHHRTTGSESVDLD